MNLLASEAAEDPRRSALLCLCRTTRRRRGYVHRLSPDWPAYHTKKKKTVRLKAQTKGEVMQGDRTPVQLFAAS